MKRGVRRNGAKHRVNLPNLYVMRGVHVLSGEGQAAAWVLVTEPGEDGGPRTVPAFKMPDDAEAYIRTLPPGDYQAIIVALRMRVEDAADGRACT